MQIAHFVLNVEHYQDVLANLDRHWETLRSKYNPQAEAQLERYLSMPMVKDYATGYPNTRDAELPLYVKRALVLLEYSMAKEVRAYLLENYEIETLYGLFFYAARDRQLTDEELELYNSINFQISILTSILQAICNECGQDNPMTPAFEILNRIPLIYNHHQIVLDAVKGSLQDYTVTRH